MQKPGWGQKPAFICVCCRSSILRLKKMDFGLQIIQTVGQPMSNPPWENRAMNDNLMKMAGCGWRRNGPGNCPGDFARPVRILVGRKFPVILAYFLLAAAGYAGAMVNSDFAVAKASLADRAAKTDNWARAASVARTDGRRRLPHHYTFHHQSRSQ